MAIPTTLPASWYCSPGLHQLERRAVFLRSWFFLGTVNKFQIGESARFEIAQIELTAVATSNGSAKVVKVFDGSSVCRRKFQNTCHSSTDYDGWMTGRRSAKPPDSHRSSVHHDFISSTIV
jgi:hypothetical protein